jgi:GNAT superfamily N-acetyltransferase
MLVRRLRDDEWEAWKGLRLRALTSDPDAFGSSLAREGAYSEEVWRERTRQFASAVDRAMFVAEGEGRLVGCCGAFLGDEGIPFIVSMWVDPAARRRGVGRELLVAVERWARDLGKERLRLHLVEGNGAAASLYLRAGFRRTGMTFPMPRDPRLIEVEMEREII